MKILPVSAAKYEVGRGDGRGGKERSEGDDEVVSL